MDSKHWIIGSVTPFSKISPKKKKVALYKNPEINKIYHFDSLLDGRVGGHAQVVVAAPHGDLLGTPGELPTEGEELYNYMAQIRTDTIVA